MSKLNTLAGGYTGGSPRVRSENSKKPFSQPPTQVINAQELVNNIKRWYSENKLTTQDIQLITNQLQEVCKTKATEYQSSVTNLESQAQDLDSQVLDLQSKLKELKGEEDIINTINILTSFFGEETIEKIKNQ